MRYLLHHHLVMQTYFSCKVASIVISNQPEYPKFFPMVVQDGVEVWDLLYKSVYSIFTLEFIYESTGANLHRCYYDFFPFICTGI